MNNPNPTRAELEEIWSRLRKYWQDHLAKHGVPEPKLRLGDPPNCEDLGLIYLFFNFGNAVDKDPMGLWINSINKSCGTDCQIGRHLRRDAGWPIHSAHHKETDSRGTLLTNKPYQYCLYGTNPPAEFIAKRTRELGRTSARTFAELVVIYDERCGRCGRKAPLSQGHMDPRIPLSIPDNCIPLCQNCNLFIADRFVVDEQGRTTTILPVSRNASLVQYLDGREKRALRSILFP
jgi:hypothetical protein